MNDRRCHHHAHILQHIKQTLLTLNKKWLKVHIAANGTPSHTYGVSLATWYHTVLPTTRHK